MQFHYALVDDLITKEEFERRVGQRMEQCGDLIDETTAAMVVVQDLGRSHVAISALSGNSTLFSFFGKVIAVNPPHEFTRKDGETGYVAHLILADETGQVRAVLWDEKAAAAAEIEAGDVLEIIGKHAPGGKRDIIVLALRKSPCEILCGDKVQPQYVPPERKTIVARILHLEEEKTIARKDGSEATLVEGCIADERGTARLVSWDPLLLSGLSGGNTVRIEGVLARERTFGREFVIDEKSTITPENTPVPFRFSSLADVQAGSTYSVQATIVSLQPPRAFTTRDGRQGHVRNILLSDGRTELPAVLWGDRALLPLARDEAIVLYHAEGKTGRDGRLELHAGSGTFIRICTDEPAEEVEREGTAIVTGTGTFLDDGDERFIVNGDLPHGHEVRVRGIRSGNRIRVISFEEIAKDPAEIRKRLESLLAPP